MSIATIRTRSRGGRRFLVACFALCALAFLTGADTRPSEMPYESPDEIPSLDPATYGMNTKAVRIMDNSLDPRSVTLSEGQLVAWVSYSPVPSTVVFEREVARNMICHSLVNFSIQEDEIRSAEIHAGEFASFCQLKAGRYRYKIVRPNAGNTAISAARRLDGEIIVKKGP